MTDPTYEPMEHEEKLAWMLETHGWGIEPVAPSDQEHLRAAYSCLLYTSPSPRDQRGSRMPGSS